MQTKLRRLSIFRLSIPSLLFILFRFLRYRISWILMLICTSFKDYHFVSFKTIHFLLSKVNIIQLMHLFCFHLRKEQVCSNLTQRLNFFYKYMNAYFWFLSKYWLIKKFICTYYYCLFICMHMFLYTHIDFFILLYLPTFFNYTFL